MDSKKLRGGTSRARGIGDRVEFFLILNPNEALKNKNIFFNLSCERIFSENVRPFASFLVLPPGFLSK